MLPNNSIATNVYQVTHAKHFHLDNAFYENSVKKSAGDVRAKNFKKKCVGVQIQCKFSERLLLFDANFWSAGY